MLAAVALVIAGCGSGPPARVVQERPAGEVLRRLCDELFVVADREFAVVSEVTRVEQSLSITGPVDAVSCAGEGWNVVSDGERLSWVELALIFKPVRDPGSPKPDYCDTKGVEVTVPLTGFEEREFGGTPYCYSWWIGDAAYGVAASYVDRSTEIYVTWSIGSSVDPFDTGTELGALFAAAHEAVLTRIYDTFGRVD